MLEIETSKRQFEDSGCSVFEKTFITDVDEISILIKSMRSFMVKFTLGATIRFS